MHDIQFVFRFTIPSLLRVVSFNAALIKPLVSLPTFAMCETYMYTKFWQTSLSGVNVLVAFCAFTFYVLLFLLYFVLTDVFCCFYLNNGNRHKTLTLPGREGGRGVGATPLTVFPGLFRTRYK